MLNSYSGYGIQDHAFPSQTFSFAQGGIF